MKRSTALAIILGVCVLGSVNADASVISDAKVNFAEGKINALFASLPDTNIAEAHAYGRELSNSVRNGVVRMLLVDNAVSCEVVGEATRLSAERGFAIDPQSDSPEVISRLLSLADAAATLSVAYCDSLK